MPERCGVKINPHILAVLFKAGITISGDTFRIRLVEDAVPAGLDLVNAFQDPETKEFVFIFGQEGEKVSTPVTWLTPIYEKENGHEADSQST
jgi:hypothetical protein